MRRVVYIFQKYQKKTKMCMSTELKFGLHWVVILAACYEPDISFFPPLASVTLASIYAGYILFIFIYFSKWTYALFCKRYFFLDTRSKDNINPARMIEMNMYLDGVLK